MRRRTLEVDGVTHVAGPRYRHPQPPPTPPRPRVFDHLTDQPEAEWLRLVAHHMRRSPWWQTVPKWSDPGTVSGEVG